jgi:hypothetical protein
MKEDYTGAKVHFSRLECESVAVWCGATMKTTLRLLIFAPLLALATASADPIALFNGKDLTGWHADVPAADKDKNIKPSFVVRDGKLVSMGVPKGHLITDKEFENYKLVVEYRFAGKPGNCGVLVHSSTPRTLGKMFPKSIEVQMMSENAGDFWCIGETQLDRRLGEEAGRVEHDGDRVQG